MMGMPGLPELLIILAVILIFFPSLCCGQIEMGRWLDTRCDFLCAVVLYFDKCQATL